MVFRASSAVSPDAGDPSQPPKENGPVLLTSPSERAASSRLTHVLSPRACCFLVSRHSALITAGNAVRRATRRTRMEWERARPDGELAAALMRSLEPRLAQIATQVARFLVLRAWSGNFLTFGPSQLACAARVRFCGMVVFFQVAAQVASASKEVALHRPT